MTSTDQSITSSTSSIITTTTKEMKVKEMLSIFTKVSIGNQGTEIIISTANRLRDLFVNSSSDDFDLLTMTCKTTGNYILHYAVDHNYESIVIELINICKRTFPDRLVTFLNFQDNHGYSCLHLASIRGKIFRSIVKLLLENGANANLESNEKETPLHLCAKRINVAISNLLLQYNADISKRDNNQMRPFQVIGLGGYSLVTSAESKTHLEERLRGNKGQLLDDERIMNKERGKFDIKGKIVFISNESDKPELKYDYKYKSKRWCTFSEDKNYKFKIITKGNSRIDIESHLRLKIELVNIEEQFKWTIKARRIKDEDNTFIFRQIVIHDPGVVNITVSLCNDAYINIEPYTCESQEFKPIRNINNTPKNRMTKEIINDDDSTDASSEMSEIEESVYEETEMDELLRAEMDESLRGYEEEISQKETAAPLAGTLLTEQNPYYDIWKPLFKLVDKTEYDRMIVNVGHKLSELHTAGDRKTIPSMPVWDYHERKMNILHRSCWYDNVRIVEMILRVTNDVNTRTISNSSKDSFGGSTALMIAAQRGHYEILEAILLYPFKSVSRSTYSTILSQNDGDSKLLGTIFISIQQVILN